LFSQLVPDYISNLETYQAGRNLKDVQREFQLERVVKLASNENPWGPSPRAIEAVSRHVQECHRYPDPNATELRTSLAERFNLSLNNIIVGNGSEGIMAFISRALLHGDDEVITSKGTFLGFPILCRTRNIEPLAVNMVDDRFDLQSMAELINPKTKLIYLCNPNNPTGTYFTKNELDRFMERVPPRVLVILDEAYYEFAEQLPEYPDSMDYRYDNVITLRTFSKAYGLAGFRVGYGFGHPDLITNLWKVKLPFQPTHLAQIAAVASLQDKEFLEMSIKTNAVGRNVLTEGLIRLGLVPIPSCTNFVMFRVASSSLVAEIYQGMLKRGVIIRPLTQMDLPDCLRISVGQPEEIELCLETLAKVLAQVLV
jgi:histidinol-phosphate aminotransferase